MTSHARMSLFEALTAPILKPKRFTYEIAWDDGPYWSGWNVKCRETGQWMRSEGFSTERKAQEFLDELEGE